MFSLSEASEKRERARARQAAPNAALIGAFTLRFHLNARRGRAARTFAATLSQYPTLRLFVTGRRGRRRGDATRVGHEEPRAVAWD